VAGAIWRQAPEERQVLRKSAGNFTTIAPGVPNRPSRADEAKAGNVAKIVGIERPEGGARGERAGGDGEVDPTAARPADGTVEAGGALGLLGSEWHGRFDREQLLLDGERPPGESRPPFPR
jgi:hypothetical protein